MTSVKITINIDEETWNRFKRAVYTRLKNLSGAVEEAIKAFDMEELMSAYMKARGIDTRRYPSLREVEEGKPRLKTSAGVPVRTMRDERDVGASGHERPKKLSPIVS